MINGLRVVGEQRLADGDIISFGSTHIRFEAS
jgi:pSer/pThr/pTyr-binding forkhead associated (FHA) protein